MAYNEEKETIVDIRQIQKVQFGILGPDEIRAMSVAEIKSSIMKENGVPKDGGLMDLHLGPVDRNYTCRSCAGDEKNCPGHFGHIELAKPCFHIGFLPFIIKVLRTVCFDCSKLLLDKVLVNNYIIFNFRHQLNLEIV